MTLRSRLAAAHAALNLPPPWEEVPGLSVRFFALGDTLTTLIVVLSDRSVRIAWDRAGGRPGGRVTVTAPELAQPVLEAVARVVGA